MRMKRSVSALLAVLFTLSLCGCQLAQEDAGDMASNDRLIGLWITREWLDLYDTEAYVQDHLNGLTLDEAEALNENSPYMGRLYASLQEEVVTGSSGNQKTLYKYAFPGIDGMNFYCANCPEDMPLEDFIGSHYDEAITDNHTSISVTDAGESVELEGTIYVSASCANKTFYLNPVYQTQDGRVYVESTGGNDFNEIDAEGPLFSQTIEDKSVITENGTSEELKNTTTLSIEILNPPTKIVVLQMDQNSEIVSRTEYEPGKLPEALVPETSTEYIILETQKVDPQGAYVVTHELFTKDDCALYSFYERADGICVKQYTSLSW